MALHSLYCADVPLRNCSLTHSGWFYAFLLWKTTCDQKPGLVGGEGSLNRCLWAEGVKRKVMALMVLAVLRRRPVWAPSPSPCQRPWNGPCIHFFTCLALNTSTFVVF